MYNYFVSFTFRSATDRVNFGSTVVKTPRKVVDHDTLTLLRSNLASPQEPISDSLVILSFQLIEE